MKITQSRIEEYLHYCADEKRLSQHTIRAYRIDLEQLLEWLKREGSESFDQPKLKQYLTHLNANYAASSTKRKIASIRAFSSYCCYGKRNANPFTDIRISIREPQRLPKTIALNDLVKLFNQKDARDDIGSLFSRFLQLRDWAMIEVLIATGIRVAELCQLDIEHCDLDGKQALITGKGSKERLVQLESEDTLQALHDYLVIRDAWLSRQNELSLGNAACQAVFLNRFGQRISEQAVRSAISRRAEQASISAHITPHMFRHTFATMLLEDDVNLRYIQNLLGHASVKTTERYTHVARAKQREVMREHNPRNAIRAVQG